MSATSNSSRTWSLTASWPKSTSTSTPHWLGPSSSSSSLIGCARCSRTIPGGAGILKTRAPLGPPSLAVAEALLGPLQTAGFTDREAGLAFFLLVDYTIGFAVSSPPPRSTSNASVTRPPGPSCTSSSARYPPTASPPWLAWVTPSGSTTATSGSPPASTSSSPGFSMPGAPSPPRRDRHDGLRRPNLAGGEPGHRGTMRFCSQSQRGQMGLVAGVSWAENHLTAGLDLHAAGAEAAAGGGTLLQAVLTFDAQPDQGADLATQLDRLVPGQVAEMGDLELTLGVLMDGQGVDPPARVSLPEP